MKKTLLFTLLLANFFFANASTRVSTYRWRNDNGTETNATWKAAANTPIQINNFDPIRLRMAIDNFSGSSLAANAQLEFSSDNGQSWYNITILESPFNLVSSTTVNDGESTTSQISATPFTYVGGLFKSTDSNTTFYLPSSSTTEHEFCLKPNSQYIETSVTYTFRIININSDVYPAISYCPTLISPPLAGSPQNLNANAKVSDLQAVGTDLKWYSSISGGIELSTIASLSTGIYYVSQTLSCESIRTEVQVNININGAALNFNGGYIDLPISMPSAYTKEAWIKGTDFSDSHNVISGGGDGMHAIYIHQGYLSAGHNGAWETVIDNEKLDTNVWYHVAVTYDAEGTMTLYKNGVAISTVSNVPAFIGSAVRIGAFDANSNLFNGTIDEARIWNKALTEAEIQEKMNCEFTSPQSGLVGYYKFNQGFEGADNSTITTLTDSSGNGNDGTLINFDLSANSSNWISSSIIQTGKTCTTLSVGGHDFSSSLKVYPNPASDAFFVNSDSNGTVVIFDLLGKIIQNQKINSGTTTLNLGSTPNGVYLLKVTNEKNQSKTVKLIKN